MSPELPLTLTVTTPAAPVQVEGTVAGGRLLPGRFGVRVIAPGELLRRLEGRA